MEVDSKATGTSKVQDALPVIVSNELTRRETRNTFLPTKVPYPKAIQYALAVAFIMASMLAAMFAATRIGRLIWRASNAVFATLASISDATREELKRSEQEARLIVVNDVVKVVVTRRYVHGMRYWQDMAMTVVLLDDVTIFYNPVPMPVDAMRAMAREKKIVIVVPNMYHHMFVDNYVAVFPSALLVGSQSAGQRHIPPLNIMLPAKSSLPTDIELLRVGGWALDEYVLVVHRVRTLVTAHFISCGTELSVGGASLLPAWLKSIVCKATLWCAAGCLPLYERLTVFDKAAAAATVLRLQELGLQTCISAHGGVCKDGADVVLRRSWGWILSAKHKGTQSGAATTSISDCEATEI
eukprot:TRINITY_DN78173_c0_g1_i1.p1 TRINITY_DN78173_c0_g1~~TRINITY_DN78173_c0_g1_i1.p1  ORF type:complete len:355 (+),score=45.13 TRINITY_DN78173_c0_g1_i1:155-1219(+)